VITIRTRLTLVVVFATLAGAIIGWLRRQHALLSLAFAGGERVRAIFGLGGGGGSTQPAKTAASGSAGATQRR